MLLGSMITNVNVDPDKRRLCFILESGLNKEAGSGDVSNV